MQTVPVRDLTEEQARGVLGKTATVKVYETAEDAEPAATLHGTIKVIGITAEVTVVVFDGAPSSIEPVSASTPVTITFDSDQPNR